MSRSLIGRVTSAAALAAALTVTLPTFDRAEAAPVPTAPTFGTSIDAYAAYDAEDTCSATPKPGVVALRDKILLPTYGGASWRYGMYRACSSNNSGHEEGRALDWMMNASVATERANAEAFLAWLLATDRYGNPHANARRLGIMYMMFNGRMWRAYQPSAGWQPQLYGGTNCANLGSAYNTLCHRDHIHISLTWDGAYQRTSYWRAALPSTATRVSITSPTGYDTVVRASSTVAVRGKAPANAKVLLYVRYPGQTAYTRLSGYAQASYAGDWQWNQTVTRTTYFYARAEGVPASGSIRVNVG